MQKKWEFGIDFFKHMKSGVSQNRTLGEEEKHAKQTLYNSGNTWEKKIRKPKMYWALA